MSIAHSQSHTQLSTSYIKPFFSPEEQALGDISHYCLFSWALINKVSFLLEKRTLVLGAVKNRHWLHHRSYNNAIIMAFCLTL